MDRLRVAPDAFADPAGLDRRAARAMYNRVIDNKTERIRALRGLLSAHGVEMGGSDAELQAFNEWFVDSVEADREISGRMTPRWYSVPFDTALFLGEVMIERYPNMSWEFQTWGGPRADGFQSHVIRPSNELSKREGCINVNGIVLGYAYRVLHFQGHVPPNDVGEVHGVKIDVNAVLASARAKPVPRDLFVSLMEVAARASARAGRG